mgnify:CR=1 FL=1
MKKDGCPPRSMLSKDKKYCILKKPLYHGTQCKHREKILQNGLLVDCSIVHRETDDYNPEMSQWCGKECRGSDTGIYLTSSLEDAASYALDSSKDVPSHILQNNELEDFDSNPDNACIATIHKLPVGTQITPDGYGDIMTKGTSIPPECIQSLHSLKEIKDNGIELPPEIRDSL